MRELRDLALLCLSLASILWCIVVWGIGVLGCWTARRRYRLRPRSPLATDPSAPGVSILRPLKGLDTNLYENLESTFQQEYPNFEIIFSVADGNDQALPIVRDLITKYPSVNVTVIIGEEDVGVNPKVNNLIRPYRQAANDILWVLDSNIMVHPGTLARSVDILEDPHPPRTTPPHRRIAVVHHVPFAFADEARIGSRIEEAFLNTNHAKMYIAINILAIDSCVVGKSNLYRRSDLERVNGSLKPAASPQGLFDDGHPAEYGLPAFGRFLAEDNMIASALWHELDLRHDLSCDVAHNAVGNMTLKDYVLRRVRWIRVRKHMVLAATVLEPLTEAVMLAVVASLSINYLLAVPLWMTLVLHFVFWICVDLDVYASLAGHPPPMRWQFLAAWAAREVLAFPIFVFAIFGNEVTWRGTRYQILRSGEVRRATPKQFGWFQYLVRWTSFSDNYEPIQAAS